MITTEQYLLLIKHMVTLPSPLPDRTCPTSVTNSDCIQNRPIRNRQVQYGNTKHVVHWIYKIRDCDLRTSAYDRCINTGGSRFRNPLFKTRPVRTCAEKLASETVPQTISAP